MNGTYEYLLTSAGQLEGKDDVGTQDEDDKDDDVQDRFGQNAPALGADIVIQDDAHAVGAMQPGKDQHEKVKQPPEGRLPTRGNPIKVDIVQAGDEVHVEQVKPDQQKHDDGRDAHKEPTIQLQVAGRAGSGRAGLHINTSLANR